MIIVPNIHGSVVIHPNSVMYIKARGSYSIIHTEDNQQIVFVKSMSQTLRKLPPEFSRVHHSFIVNHLYIKSLDKSNSNLKLKNDTVIPISRRKKKNFINQLEQ